MAVLETAHDTFDHTGLTGVGGGNAFAVVRLTASAVQSIGASAFTSVTFDTETEDAEGMHAGSSAQIIVPAGLNGRRARLRANVGLAANATGARQARIIQNVSGTPVTLAYITDLGTSSISFREELNSDPIVLATGDTFDVQLWQNSGGSLNTVNSDGLPSFCLYTVD